jgi:ABC-type sugar transport system substrate-binding protein
VEHRPPPRAHRSAAARSSPRPEAPRQPALLVSRSRRGAQTAAREIYAETAAASGFTPLIAEADETSGEDGAFAAAEELLAAHPDIDAVLAPIDTFATGAVRAAQESGEIGRRGPAHRHPLRRSARSHEHIRR